ncbi:MAG: peptidylprolyl isomerase [Chloroflexota bacterium]
MTWLLAISLILGACDSAAAPLPTLATVNTRAPVASATARMPTSTSTPLAATVNGQPIFLSEYQSELARYESAATSLGQKAEGDYKARVLTALIDKSLMLQEANAAGIKVTEAQLAEAYNKAISERGNEAAFNQWLTANFYTADGFRAALKEGMILSAMQAQIATSVPTQAEQVHARHILLTTQDDANKVLADLKAGGDFAKIAVARSLDQSRVNGGDLGWFAINGLTVPEVAKAAFDLQPKQTSGVVKTALGFHVVQTLERGTRPLSPTSLALMQQQAVNKWIEDLRAKAAIHKFV